MYLLLSFQASDGLDHARIMKLLILLSITIELIETLIILICYFLKHVVVCTL